MSITSSIKEKMRNVAVEALTQKGPMTSRAILDYAISYHKGVRWVPHTSAISSILATDPKGRFLSDQSDRREWRLKG